MSMVDFPTRTEPALDEAVRAIVESATVSYQGDEWVVDCAGTELRAASQRGLAHALSSHLYSDRHAGIPPTDADDFVPALQQDRALEERLVAASAQLTRTERLTVIETIDGADGAVVLLQGVRVFVPGTVVHGRGRATVDALLPTLAPRLSIGFLFYTPRIGAGRGGRPLRVYRQLRDADEAVAVWKRFTAWAESAQLPLRAKVLSQSWGLPRNDGLVVYLPTEGWHRLDEIASVLESADETPLSAFARPLARGVSLAWEPHDLSAGGTRTSFGEHRASAIARGIVAAAADDASAERHVRAELLAANVDPAAVYRNLDSPSLEWWVDRAGVSRQNGSGFPPP